MMNSGEKRRESKKVKLIFALFGFVAYCGFSLIVTSAQDLLKENTLPTGGIWVCTSLPSFILSSTIPYVFDRVPVLFWVASIASTNIAGVLLVTLGPSVLYRLAGTVFLGVFLNLADVTSISMTAYYHRETVSAYCAGTGVGYLFAPIYYTAMTTWFGIPYKVVIATAAVLAFIYFTCFCLLDKRRREKPVYEIIPTSSRPNDSDDDGITANYLTIQEKLHVTWSLASVIFQIFIGLFCHILVLSSVMTTIIVPDFSIPPSDQYKYYLIWACSGLCIGRGYLSVANFLWPGLSGKLLVRNTWLISLISIGHVVVLVLASWYRFLDSIWYALLLVLSLGFFSEAIYANQSIVISELPDARCRELAMGLTVTGIGLGSVLASAVSNAVEMALRNHCLGLPINAQYCFTRIINVTDTIT